MLIWLAALHCEAKPIIDHYALKKSADLHAFDVYANDSMQCVVSGIGKTSAAAATAWIAGLNHAQRSIAWINIGTAGAKTTDIGTLLRISRIKDADSDLAYYPVPVIDSKIEFAYCKTLSGENYCYDSEWAFDMEASAFFETASRFSSAELVQCLKLVSDNTAHKTGRDKHQISRLILRRIDLIADFADKLERINKLIENQQIAPSEWQKLTALAHFTQTQKSQLRKSVRFLHSRGFGFSELQDQLHAQPTSTLIIARLDQLCAQLSRDL